ncbi:MAG: hypothetical protein AAF743_10345, partial [Planctomycetota bacterium]
MKRWIRRILVTLVVLALLLVGGVAAAWWALGEEPDWYQAALERQRSVAASPDTTLINAASAVNELHRQPDTQQPITVTLTEAQLNGALQGKSTFDAAKALTARLQEPVIDLSPGRVTLAGRAVKIDKVVALTIEPAVEEGMLSARVVSLRGGRLPLPKAMLDEYREPGLRELRARMPRWVRVAALQSNDLANDAAAAAVHGKVAQALLAEEPIDAVLMLPVDEGESGWMPVRVEAFEVTDDALTIELVPLEV